MTKAKAEKIERLYQVCLGVSYFDFLKHTDPSGVRSAHIEDPDAEIFEYDLGEPDGTPLDLLFQY